MYRYVIEEQKCRYALHCRGYAQAKNKKQISGQGGGRYWELLLFDAASLWYLSSVRALPVATPGLENKLFVFPKRKTSTTTEINSYNKHAF